MNVATLPPFGASLRDAPRAEPSPISKPQAAQNTGAKLLDYFQEHYQQLRMIARRRLHKGAPFTLLDSVGLVSEAFTKMGRQAPPTFESEQHFLAYMSAAMRTVIIDYARARGAERRGGHAVDATLDTNLLNGLPADPGGLIEVDDALKQLAQVDPRLAEVVELRFFGGFTEEEIAEASGVSGRTVKREWEKARLMLATMLSK